MPGGFAETPEGILLYADGMAPMLRWDGLTTQMEAAGVLAPISAPVLSGSGVGKIVGTYDSFIRFIDRNNQPSDLSPISNELTPVSASGVVTGVTNATPMVVTTSVAHGLLTGSVVKIQGVGGATGANATNTITVLSATTFSLDDSVGSGDYTGGGTWTAGVSTLTFSSLPSPTESKIVRRQILRNTDGQKQTYFVDIDTTDLTSTSLSSTRLDDDLAAQEAVPLLAANGAPLANRFGIPPNWKCVLAAHLDRMFAAVDVVYTQGSAAITFGSTTVTGIGTEWTSSLAGRELWINGSAIKYEILSCNETTQTLTLAVPCQAQTDPYANYAIRPSLPERRIIYYSEAGLPEAWPAVNAIAVQEDGDELTGLMPFGSFLYILERRHIYRFTFQSDPATDGFVFLSLSGRGCVNNRCWVPIEDNVFMLDEQGIHAFSGGSDDKPASVAIQDIFRRDGLYSVNWAASSFFHAVADTNEQIVHFFVCLSGHYLPRHSISFNYRLNRWWLLEYDTPIGCSTRVDVNAGQTRVYLGSSAARVLLSSEGSMDGPDPTATTTRGTVTAAGLVTLTDTAASFSGVVGSAVTIDDGTGKGQVRQIASITGTTLTLTEPWLVMPDTTSVYVIGGVRWKFRSATRRLVPSEQETERRVEVIFEPVDHAALMTLRLYFDAGHTAAVWANAQDMAAGAGVRTVNNSPDLVADLTKPIGQVQKRLDGRKDYYADGNRFVALELSGTQGRDGVSIYEVTIDGVIAPGGDQ